MIDKIFLMKKTSAIKDFGKRLASIRQARGYSQRELARQIGISQRMLAYYEVQSQHVPVNLLIPLSKTLKVSLEEMLGLKGLKEQINPQYKSLWKKLKKVELLDPRDQKAILRMIDIVASKSNNHDHDQKHVKMMSSKESLT